MLAFGCAWLRCRVALLRAFDSTASLREMKSRSGRGNVGGQSNKGMGGLQTVTGRLRALAWVPNFFARRCFVISCYLCRLFKGFADSV